MKKLVTLDIVRPKLPVLLIRDEMIDGRLKSTKHEGYITTDPVYIQDAITQLQSRGFKVAVSDNNPAVFRLDKFNHIHFIVVMRFKRASGKEKGRVCAMELDGESRNTKLFYYSVTEEQKTAVNQALSKLSTIGKHEEK